MYTKIIKIMICVAVISLSFGCANKSKIKVTVDCDQPLTIIIDSPVDKVSKDGFTIYLVEINTKTLEKLTNDAIKIQNSYGCKNSLDKLLNG